MEYSKEDLMEAKKQIWGVGENMGTEESKKIWEENAQFWDNAIFAFCVQHTVNCRWCYAGQICQGIDGNTTLQTQRMNTPRDCFFCVRRTPPPFTSR